MPPKGMFVGSQRPKGLEFASCPDCNRKSSRLDDFAAFLVSAFSQNELSDAQAKHFLKKFKGLQNNNPLLLDELNFRTATTSDGKTLVDKSGSEFGAMFVDGPLASDAIFRFGAKVGMALHYQATNEIAASDHRVVVFAFTNANAVNGEIPLGLFDLLPERSMLAQGKITSEGIFEYQSAKVRDGKGSAHWATLGASIYYNLFVGPNMILPEEKRGFCRTFLPGCLQRH